MYAIIETGARQYWVSVGDTLQVDKVEGEPGAELTFKALWSSPEGEGQEGGVQGQVKAQVVRQLRGPKILVFKKRSKKNYSRMQGHRQFLTEIRVTDISAN